MNYYIGVISDTHGILRPEALEALRGSSLIVHAGDIGKPEILDELQTIAPVYAVKGNVDWGPWTRDIPTSDVVPFAGKSFYVLHDLYTLDLDPVAAGFHAVISGHSHRPEIRKDKDLLYLNPGSAGPRRFTLPVTVARIVVTKNSLKAEIISLPT